MFIRFKDIRFYHLFIILWIVLSFLGIALFVQFEKTTEDVEKAHISNILQFARDIGKNFGTTLQTSIDGKIFEKLQKDKVFRSQLEQELSMLQGKAIAYIYLLEPYGKQFRFLIDGSQKDRAEFGEIYQPIEIEHYKTSTPHYFFHQHLTSLWMSYIYPILLQDGHKVLLVFDFSMDYYQQIKRRLQDFWNLYFFSALFVVFLMFLILLFAFWDRKREKRLRELNASLKRQVKAAVEENRKKDLLLFEQAKLSQMGEMISMIAHQWRQPLNVIVLAAMKLSLKSQRGELTPQEVEQNTAIIERTAQRMSKIIDEFLNFSKRSRRKKRFLLKEAVEGTLDLVHAQFQNNQIDVKFELCECYVEANKGDIEHILLILLSNAKDAMEGLKNKEIRIRMHEEGQMCAIYVQDSGPGVPKELVGRIFEPYFSTKEEGKGVGLGLYMAKRIASEHLGGDLELIESEEGAVFVLKIPKA